jgi:hypothetical protein
VTIAELLVRFEQRRQEADSLEATGPLANVYALVVQELRELDGVPAIEPKVDTTTAGQLEGVDRSTMAKRCADGWYPNAEKTSEAGEWRIPLSDLRAPARPQHGGRGPQTPTLISGGRK